MTSPEQSKKTAEITSDAGLIKEELIIVEENFIKGADVAKKEFKSLSHVVGPGVVTGASDDDPSGIGTYSSVGAQYGLSLNWLTLFAFPMMIAMQEISARIGVVTGMGLAGVLKKKSSKKIMFMLVGLLIIANTVNIGADLGAMAAATGLIIPLPFYTLAIFYALLLVFLEVAISYRKYARILKWLTVSLFAYLATALIVTDSWKEVFLSLLNPSFQFNKEYLMVVVGFLGTTISPYLYFWQASEEVEEALETGTKLGEFAPSPKQLKIMRGDVFLGTLFSQATAFFIILTTALTLNRGGILQIASASDAAKALAPLAGSFASLVFAIGIIGTGLLGIPVLAGSGAYAVAESYNWKEGLSLKFRQARGFYAVIIVSTLIGLLIDFLHINPMKALVYAAVVNGVAAVPLIALMVRVGADKNIMHKYTNGFWSNLFGWLTFGVMGVAVILMFWGFAK